MKILIACEESQIVCKEFRKLGHETFSCDTKLCSGGHPEWHIHDDVLKVLNGGRCYLENGVVINIDKWDLIIAHPPCTYLSKAGACRMYKPAGVLVEERYKKGLIAKDFFMKLLNAPCKRVCVENPVSLKVFNIPKHTQEIQPYMFGHSVSKKTRLWLKGLSELKPTKIMDDYIPFLPSNTGGKKRGQMARTDKKLTRDPTIASKTFKGIAKAMAEQWGGLDG